MKKIYVIVQDSAYHIDKDEVIRYLDSSIKENIIFGRLPFTPPGELLTESLKGLFDCYRKEDPESWIIFITSSVIYGTVTGQGTNPEKLSGWFKQNFKNSIYAVRSGGQYRHPTSETIDFAFLKTPENQEKGIADNILEIYNHIFKKN